MKFNCWEENVGFLKQLCKDENLKCSSKVLHTDIEGDTLCEFTIEGQLSNKAQDHYQKNRIRK